MDEEDLLTYDRREQTYVKHELLKNYLLPFALIIGQHHRSITYVDCFSGPWESKKPDLKDAVGDHSTLQFQFPNASNLDELNAGIGELSGPGLGP